MTAVSANKLSKGYRQYKKPSDSLKELILRRPFHQMFWALRNIDFDLEPGSTLGVIGDNGAGKSTLLKLLAGTIKPTVGSLEVYGRVSAILELGSGFHPEFTGIENIRIGCAVLGLNGAEIQQKIPEIIEFSELGDAVYRPVKNYSSGMYVRLAFSVVTSVDPDILIIDEALSVGDQHFQRKSLDRIRGFISAGKTVVFCSHNLYQIKSLCKKVLWLDQGEMRMIGKPEDVVEAYLDHCRERDALTRELEAKKETSKDADGKKAEILDCTLSGHDGEARYQTGDNLELQVSGKSYGAAADDLTLAVVLMRNDNIHVYGSSTQIDGVAVNLDEAGNFAIKFRLPKLQLLSGKFSVYLYLLDGGGIHIYDKRENTLDFSVRHDSREVGVSRLSHEWEA